MSVLEETRENVGSDLKLSNLDSELICGRSMTVMVDGKQVGCKSRSESNIGIS